MMRTRLLGTLPVVLAAWMAAAPGTAQESVSGLELEQLLRLKVVTASKVEEQIRDAPGVISVVTREEIEAFGAVSLVDILDRIASFQLISSHLWVQAKSVVRGNLITHADNQILVLINGRPFRDALESNSNWVLYTAFPVDLIDRIEVVRGPGSVLYGSNALSGVINIITQHPEKTDIKLTGGGGSFGAGLGSGKLALGGKDWSLLVGANYFGENGWPFAAATNFPDPRVGVVGSQKDYGESNKSGALSFSYKRLSAEAAYFDGRYDDLGIEPHWIFAGHVSGKRSFLDLSYTQPLSSAWDLKASVTLNGWEKHIVDTTEPGLDDNKDRTLAGVFELAANGKIGDKTNVVVGGLTEKRKNYDVVPFIPNQQSAAIPLEYSENHYSAYLQADTKPVERLKVIGGAQYNHTASGKDDVVPRAGVIYAITESVSAKVLYGQAFRTATPIEEYVDVPGILVGRSDLQPEKVETFDAQVFVGTKQQQYTFTYFHNKFTDLVARIPAPDQPTGTFTFTNSGQNRIQGGEFEYKGRLAGSLLLTGSATYQHDDDDVLYIPEYMLKAGVFYKGKDFVAGVFYSRFGKPKENAPIDGLQLNPPAEPIDLVSANVSYTFRAGVPVTLSVYGNNLLGDDMSYTEFARGWTNTLPIGPGRAVYGKVTLAF
jgi:outer membrane receptor for ferrienterochelin and colicins